MKSGQVKTAAGIKTFCIVFAGVVIVLLTFAVGSRIAPRNGTARPFSQERAFEDMVQWWRDNGVILSVDREASPVTVVYRRADWPTSNAREARRRTEILCVYVADGGPVRVVDETGALLSEFDGTGPLEMLGELDRQISETGSYAPAP